MFQHEYAHPQQRGPIAYEVLSKFCAQLTCRQFVSIREYFPGLRKVASRRAAWLAL